jgi:hypothetical protein
VSGHQGGLRRPDSEGRDNLVADQTVVRRRAPRPDVEERTVQQVSLHPLSSLSIGRSDRIHDEPFSLNFRQIPYFRRKKKDLIQDE